MELELQPMRARANAEALSMIQRVAHWMTSFADESGTIPDQIHRHGMTTLYELHKGVVGDARRINIRHERLLQDFLSGRAAAESQPT